MHFNNGIGSNAVFQKWSQFPVLHNEEHQQCLSLHALSCFSYEEHLKTEFSDMLENIKKDHRKTSHLHSWNVCFPAISIIFFSPYSFSTISVTFVPAKYMLFQLNFMHLHNFFLTGQPFFSISGYS